MAAVIETENAPPLRWRDVFGDSRLRLTLGLLAIEFLVGMQSLIVAATMPKIVHEIGGLDYYGWIFSAFWLAGLPSAASAGYEADRDGPRRPIVKYFLIFFAGTFACAVAPNMPLLAAARALQGYGGGGAYTAAYGAVATSYPEKLRPRVMTLLMISWVIASLIGPVIGVFVAQAAGWRWDFLIVVPLLVIAVAMLAPALQRSGTKTIRKTYSHKWPILLTIAIGAVVGGLAAPSWPVVPLIAGGVVLAVYAAVRVLPSGIFRLAPGLPAAVGLAFLVNVAFNGVEPYVPLMLVSVLGQSLTTAGIAVTVGTVSWSIGSWWQATAAQRFSTSFFSVIGLIVVIAGMAGTACGLAGFPIWFVMVSWFVAGLGMGVVFQALFVAAMDFSESGEEGTAVAARLISGRIGIGLGTGITGGFVAMAQTLRFSLATALLAIFIFCGAVAIVSALFSRRVGAA